MFSKIVEFCFFALAVIMVAFAAMETVSFLMVWFTGYYNVSVWAIAQIGAGWYIIILATTTVVVVVGNMVIYAKNHY